jgi:hypothetical protein
MADPATEAEWEAAARAPSFSAGSDTAGVELFSHMPLHAQSAGAAAAAAAAVSAFLAWIRSPCLRHCVHGASIGGGSAAVAAAAAAATSALALAWQQHCVTAAAGTESCPTAGAVAAEAGARRCSWS